MSQLNRAVSWSYQATRRAGWRSRACEPERVAFHEIGHILVKLAVEHAHAVRNLARVSQLVQKVRSSTAAADGAGSADFHL